MNPFARRAEAEWYSALDLAERVALWRERGSPHPLPTADPGVAAWRLREWKSQPPFDDGDAFDRYLASLGLAEAEFRGLLGVPCGTLREWCDQDPEWMQALERTLARQGVPLPWVGGDPGQRQILEVFSPFLLDARDRFDAAAADAAGGDSVPPFAPGTVGDLFIGDLLVRVLGAVSRVFTLELHVARLQEVLVGETPVERFGSFVERLSRPEALAALLKSYPLLARMLVCLGDHWVQASAEILQHLRSDEPALRETFHAGEPLGQLVRVDGTGVGDPHRGGRSVAILHFSSGLRLVHKPRSLSVDRAFHDLLRWVEEGAGISFRTPATVCRDSYGWVEFVHAAPCAGREEVELYYRRLGGLLALLHVLDGQDMHMENVVAAGAHPVLVDLETLLHPIGDEMMNLAGDDYGEPASVAGGSLEPPEVIARSVFKVGLLPQRVWAEDDNPGIDLSAVGGIGNQVAPGQGLLVENAGSDEMRLVRSELFLAAAHNQPQLASEAIEQTEYADAVDQGFTSVYETLASRAAELSPDGKLAPFRDLPLRVVVRMTRTYASLLRESSHPDLLRDATDQDRLFDKLWLGTRDRPALRRVIPLEQEALRRGDVPMFFAAPSSRDLVSDGGVVLTGFFHSTGLERITERVASLGSLDLERQRLFVRASMATLSTDPLTPSEPAPPAFGSIIARPRPEPQTTPLREQLLRVACGVGEHLSATALWGPRKASWANLTTGDGRSSVAGYARYDLHAGLPGILLFLDRLGEVTGTSEFDALFRSAFLMLRDLLHDGEVSLVNVGAFSGMGGILAAFGGIRTEWYDLPVERLADRVIARLGERVPEHRTCSLFGGLAGGVAGLLSYHAATGSEAALDTALRGGDRLLALMTRADGRPDWPSVHPSPPHATGFAFGTAGIAWTLLRLADAVGDGRFRAPALDALESAWLRYAASGRTPATSATWCHGAPGMVLSLLEAHRDGVPALLTALEVAIGETLRGVDTQTTHALCNGVLGTLDVLLQAGDALGTTLRPRVEVRIRTVLDEAARDGWKCGVPLGIEPPGLMNGLAGIGYGLLRVADPDRVPSALTLGLPAGGTHRAEPFAPLM